MTGETAAPNEIKMDMVPYFAPYSFCPKRALVVYAGVTVIAVDPMPVNIQNRIANAIILE